MKRRYFALVALGLALTIVAGYFILARYPRDPVSVNPDGQKVSPGPMPQYYCASFGELTHNIEIVDGTPKRYFKVVSGELKTFVVGLKSEGSLIYNSTGENPERLLINFSAKLVSEMDGNRQTRSTALVKCAKFSEVHETFVRLEKTANVNEFNWDANFERIGTAKLSEKELTINNKHGISCTIRKDAYSFDDECLRVIHECGSKARFDASRNRIQVFTYYPLPYLRTDYCLHLSPSIALQIHVIPGSKSSQLSIVSNGYMWVSEHTEFNEPLVLSSAIAAPLGLSGEISMKAGCNEVSISSSLKSYTFEKRVCSKDIDGPGLYNAEYDLIINMLPSSVCFLDDHRNLKGLKFHKSRHGEFSNGDVHPIYKSLNSASLKIGKDLLNVEGYYLVNAFPASCSKLYKRIESLDMSFCYKNQKLTIKDGGINGHPVRVDLIENDVLTLSAGPIRPFLFFYSWNLVVESDDPCDTVELPIPSGIFQNHEFCEPVKKLSLTFHRGQAYLGVNRFKVQFTKTHINLVGHASLPDKSFEMIPFGHKKTIKGVFSGSCAELTNSCTKLVPTLLDGERIDQMSQYVIKAVFERYVLVEMQTNTEKVTFTINYGHALNGQKIHAVPPSGPVTGNFCAPSTLIEYKFNENSGTIDGTQIYGFKWNYDRVELGDHFFSIFKLTDGTSGIRGLFSGPCSELKALFDSTHYCKGTEKLRLYAKGKSWISLLNGRPSNLTLKWALGRRVVFHISESEEKRVLTLENGRIVDSEFCGGQVTAQVS